MRTLDRCTLLALAAGALAAQSLDAQEAQPRTHTVVRGDNLWDLSQRYLGNAFLWPEIYRLNRDVVEDPHWIYPGEVLRLPGDSGIVIAQVPPGAEQPPAAQPPAAQPPVDPAAPTVFTRRQRTGTVAPVNVGDPVGVINDVPAPTVRAGEVLVAPYVDREGGPRGFGRILKSGDLTGVAQATDRYRFQAYDRVFIAPPVGFVAPEGERYLSVRLGPILEDQGQIIIPTGIVEITKAPRSDFAAVAKIVRAFDEISAEDRLIPLDTTGVGTTVRPLRVADGPSTTIRWIAGEFVLPNVQNFVVLAVSSRNGVRMGDEFLIYKPSPKPEDGALRDPEIPIAKAQVVRSTPYGVTAVILGQEQPAIKEGMSARVVARMP
jgi:LysM repeat protein